MNCKEKITIRAVEIEDAEEILNIYAPYVQNTDISFETEVPTKEKFIKRIEDITAKYPYFVCECDGKIVGYAYATRHRERAAYRYSVDVSIYIQPKYHRQGIGSCLYENLFDKLIEQGYYTAYAGITVPNEKSVGLHKAMGFHEVGIYHNVGYKLGKWKDVMWLERKLRDYASLSE